MAETSGTGGVAGSGGVAATPVDWIAAEKSPEFRELIKRKNAFVIPATIFFFVWYFGFIILAGYAEDFMGERIYQGFTVGYAIALTNFIMVWTLGWLYLRQADRVFDPLAERAARRAVETGAGAGRLDRGEASGGSVRPTGGDVGASRERG